MSLNTEVSKAKQAADVLRQEAKQLIRRLVGFPEGGSNDPVDRIVDCIVGAAVLEVAAIQEQAAKDKPSGTNP